MNDQSLPANITTGSLVYETMLVAVVQEHLGRYDDALLCQIRHVIAPLELEDTLRKIISDWLETAEGRRIASEENHGEYNWGDFVDIPEDFLLRYGVLSVKVVNSGSHSHIMADHDENFWDDDGALDDLSDEDEDDLSDDDE